MTNPLFFSKHNQGQRVIWAKLPTQHLSWQSNGTPQMPTPGNKALLRGVINHHCPLMIRDKALFPCGGWHWRVPLDSDDCFGRSSTERLDRSNTKHHHHHHHHHPHGFKIINPESGRTDSPHPCGGGGGGNQWLICPDHKAGLFLGGGRLTTWRIIPGSKC